MAVYDECREVPEVGEGLNTEARVTLYGINDKPGREQKLIRVSEKDGGRFISYNPCWSNPDGSRPIGEWVFEVPKWS